MQVMGTDSMCNFLSAQAQRKQAVKSSPEKNPLTTQTEKHSVSSKEAHKLQTATQDIKQSLNIVLTTDTKPVATDVQKSSDKETYKQDGASRNIDLIEQVEQSWQDFKETKETIQRLGGIINAVAISSDDLPKHNETLALAESNIAGSIASEQVGDGFVQVALTGGLSGQASETEQYSEAFQPEDTVQPSIGDVTIAGEIVGTGSNVEPMSTDANITQPLSATPSKKPKRQIAALFMNS